MKQKMKFYIPGRASLLFLRLALPLVTLEGVAILIHYLIDREKDAILAFEICSSAMFDFLATILVAVLLAVATDAIDREIEKRNHDE